jgi:colicin import membrane protein
MVSLRTETKFTKEMEPKWSRMFVLSGVFHAALFSLIFFVPESIPTRRMGATVYEVDLVAAPTRGKRSTGKERTVPGEKKGLPVSREATPAKLIREPEKHDEKTVNIGKKIVKPKKKKAKKTKPPPSRFRQALAKIERKVKAKEKDPVGRAIARLESEVKRGGGKGDGVGGAPMGFAMNMYRLEVKERIKNNWSYPVALGGSRGQKNLEAIVVVRAEKNGAIVKSWFMKKSSNPVFDESVLKAIERSDPLPPFPEGYRRTFDELEINFNLRDLEGD